MTTPRHILVTSALPYANGDIHIGHLVEYLQTDFWVRFQKMQGHNCRYFCADDTHGTPIMLRARKDGITPEELIERYHKEHSADFADFEIEFDNYFSTHSPINKDYSEKIFKAAQENGHIDVRPVNQLFCEKDSMFLPDRFVKGICPNCKAEDQYGDGCESCNASYAPDDLENPSCSICGTPPIKKDSDHLFFKLNDYKSFLQEWLPQHTSKDTAKKLFEWFDEDLRDWDISRDAPYFGFEIPGYPDKYFYVWVDAPIGYMASATDWCNRNNMTFEELWNGDHSEIYHFIGKDIVRFHCLFWPAMLKSAGYKTPNQIFVHGFLTVNGEKMSKSKGTFISARTYLNHLDPMYLRFYYACKLNASADDLDLSFQDFVSRVNADLVNKITNLASRGAQMLHKKLDGNMGTVDDKGRALIERAQAMSDSVGAHFEAREFGKGMVEIRALADEANVYFDEAAPWKSIKEDPEAARSVLTSILNVFRVLAIYMKPILPDYVSKVEALFGEDPYTWGSAQSLLENSPVQPYEYLASRIDDKAIDAIIEETRENAAG